jgi:hypothetical protein
MGNLDEREHGAGIGLCVNEALTGEFFEYERKGISIEHNDQNGSRRKIIVPRKKMNKIPRPTAHYDPDVWAETGVLESCQHGRFKLWLHT